MKALPYIRAFVLGCLSPLILILILFERAGLLGEIQYEVLPNRLLARF